jgi:hypothetical protein
MTSVMVWLLKALLVAAKTRRGRKLLFAGAVAASDLAQSERARKLYAKALSRVDEHPVAQSVTRRARRVAQGIRS